MKITGEPSQAWLDAFSRGPAIDFVTAPGKAPYSFMVMIDGEHRATFKPEYGKRGYTLVDAYGKYSIREQAAGRGAPKCITAKSQKDFAMVTARVLDRIPTRTELANKAAAEVAQRAALQRDQEAADRLERVQRLGPALLQHLENLATAAAEMLDGGGGMIRANKLRLATQAAIKVIADAHGRGE